jgi:hypothetical protein
MTRTVVRFRNTTNDCATEAEAYVWLLNQFLKDKGNFFIQKSADLKAYYDGERGAALFSPTGVCMNRPVRLDNGWYAETCLNEDQKIGCLYLLAQTIGISSETDYQWQADGRQKRILSDVSTLLREIENLPNRSGELER